MLFSSVIFIVYFLPLFLAAYLLTGMRTATLLTGSVVFYTWGEAEYIFLLAALIVANFFFAGLVRRSKGKKRIFYLVAALILDLGVLATFKYGNFIGEIINSLARHQVLLPFHLRLPLGISFFTFQLI